VGAHKVSFPNLFADLCRLLPEDTAQRLGQLYQDPRQTTKEQMLAVLEAFPSGRTVVLLDNFEDFVGTETFALTDGELDEALRTVLSAPQHGLKVILTTRVAPRELLLVQPGLQRRLDLDEGLASPHAESILRAMDPDGKLGLEAAPDALLAEARERTRGYPRALEALVAILAADRDTSLPELLAEAGGLLPENVVEALVGEAFNRLDPLAQQVMQALAILGVPVPPVAVDYLLQPYRVAIDSAAVLGRLVNMQFVRRDAGRYYLHQVDREYALGHLPHGQPADRDATDPPFTCYGLRHRGADYFRQTRKPRAAWQQLDDLAPQLAEFGLRCQGDDYNTAAAVLLDIDFDYLLLWGHYRLMVELHQQLQGKLTNPDLKQDSTGNLGSALFRMGRYPDAMQCYEEALALARLREDRQGEARWLGNLGLCYADLGEVRRAIDHHEQALTIDRDLGDRRGEATRLGNLGDGYADREAWEQAIQRYDEAIRIADEIGLVPSQSEARYGLATARLFLGELSAAREVAEAAHTYDYPPKNAELSVTLGAVLLRQGHDERAGLAFTKAVAQADTLLEQTSDNYRALDSKALALCGLALLDDGAWVSETIAVVQAARAISRDAGVVRRVLRLFDTLAAMDRTGILVPVRAIAASENR
jgi:tetratricopeptide (TPR) repeat protein